MKRFIAFIRNPWVTRIYLLVLLLWVLAFFVSQGEGFRKVLGESKPALILLAVIPYFIVVGLINPYLHRVAYKEIGSVVSFWQAFRIFHLSRIGNYLPGRVWFASNYYIFSKKINIDTNQIAKNFVVLNALFFMVGSICSIPILYLFSPLLRDLVILFPFLMLILIHPKILNAIFKPFIRKKTGKEFTPIFLTKICVLYFIAYLIFGLSLYACLLAFETVGMTHLPLVIAAASSSLVIGLLAIFAPAGIGVTEGISAAILAQIIPLKVAVMVVLALRMVMVLVDFSCALVSAISVAREDKLNTIKMSET